MDDAVGMHHRQGAGHARGDGEGVGLCECAAARRPCAQGFAVEVFHDDVGATIVGVAIVVEARQAGVVQLGDGFCFEEKAPHRGGFLRHLAAEHFDGDAVL